MASPAPFPLTPLHTDESVGTEAPRPNRATRRHPPKMQRAYCGVAEAAVYLDITEKTVRKMIARGELAAYRLNPRIIKIRIADLDALGQRIGCGA
jgi:excisionase family DNA binding protein